MDRQTPYSGQVPRTVDLLQTQQNMMVALAKLSAALLGTTTVVNGFNCTPTAPATLDVVLTPGEIYQLENLEETAWSVLGQNLTTQILKQGIGFVANGQSLGWGNPATIAITPPTTFGYSQVYLIEVQYTDLDSGSLVLPYYNAANPTVPFSGPGNAGTAQNTIRYGGVAYQLKAGVAATTGTQAAPTADAGWTPLFTVTVAQGQTTITAGNITQLIGTVPPLPTAQPPYIPVTLPQVPVSVQSGMWLYGVDSSPGGTVATTASTATSSAVLALASIPAWLTTGMVAFDISTPGAITGGQTISSIVGNNVTLSGNVNATVNSGDVIAFSNNAMTATFDPPISTLTPGMTLRIKAKSYNTGTLTLNVGTGFNAVKRANLSNCVGMDVSPNQDMEVTWDGSEWQLANYLGQPTAGGGGTVNVTNNYETFAIPYTADTSGTANSVVAPFNPAITSPTAGEIVVVKLANTVTGPTQITVNSLAAIPILNQFLQPLANGDAIAGEMMILTYTGSAWQLIGAGGLVQQFGGLVGNYSNLVGSASGATKTANWTVGGIVAAGALNGRTYKGAGLSLSFNGGASNGPNGMDVGSMPVSADVSVYAIYNPTTQTWATLGCAGATSNGTIYTGANLPSGYVASALMFSGKTDASGNIVQFHQYDWDIDVEACSVVNLAGPQAAPYQVSLALAVPSNAVTVSGFADTAYTSSYGTTSELGYVAPTSAGMAIGGSQPVGRRSGLGGQGTTASVLQFTKLPIPTSQTLWWSSGQLSGSQSALGDVTVTGYGLPH